MRTKEVLLSAFLVTLFVSSTVYVFSGSDSEKETESTISFNDNDPLYQYELGKVIGVYDGDDYLLHGDIMVQWANGAVRNELYCELHHVEIEE